MGSTPQENLLITERILRLREKIVALEEQEAELTEEQTAELLKAETQLSKLLKFNEKRLKLAKGLHTVESELSAQIKGQISDVSSLSSIYNGLKQTNIANLRIAQQSLSTVQAGLLKDEDKKAILESTLEGVKGLQDLQKQLAETGPEELEKQEAIREQYKFQESLLRDTLSVKHENAELTDKEFNALEKILDSQQSGLAVASKYATINAETKEIIQGQLDAYKAVGKTIRGVIGTAKVLANPIGLAGAALIGFGKTLGKVGEVNKELGTTFADMTVQSAAMSVFFENYAQTVKSLNKEFGSASESSGMMALNVEAMAMTFGVSQAEASSLVGAFSRLNGNSKDVGFNMAETSREFARQNDLNPSQLLADMAASTEEFALYGKDGGKNILEAAGYAQKLGVEMSTLSKVTDGLLDFESSINKELELGALLGKNINFTRARSLAYEEDMAGAVRETIRELGGITEFNNMDPIAKRKAAEAVNLTVGEFQKMAAMQEKGVDLSKVQMEQYDTMGNLIEGGMNKSLGKVTEYAGTALIAFGQIGSQLFLNNRLIKAFNAQQSLSNVTGGAGGITQGVDRRGRSFTRGANGRFMKAPTVPMTPTPGPSNVNQMGGGINMRSVLQGAAAMLILAGAMFVFAKAAQEFGDDVKWDQVFIGIGAMATLGVVAGILGIGPIAAAVGIGTLLILGLSVAFGIFAVGALGMATAVTMIANTLPLLGSGISALVPMIGGIFGLSFAFAALGASLAVLGTMGLAALPVLLGIGAAAAGLGLLFGALGVGESSSGLETESISKYEESMLSKMDTLIESVNATRDVYMDKTKVTNLILSEIPIKTRNNVSITPRGISG
jgi:hypothetical protein